MFLFLNDPEQEKEYCNACMHHSFLTAPALLVCVWAGREDLALEVIRHFVSVMFLPIVVSFYLLPIIGLYRLAVRAVRWFKGI